MQDPFFHLNLQLYDPTDYVLGPGETAPNMTTASSWFVDYTPQMSYDN
jgi:hypothetical protein